jgi:hypothetical protein
MAVPGNAPQTTRFTRIVTAIADIVALENSRYDDVIPARHLYHLFEATALLHPDRPALSVMKGGDLEEAAAHFSGTARQDSAGGQSLSLARRDSR